MQTFLPHADFIRSAAVLDRKRLGKQRVEALQILHALSGETKAWRNHPVTRMWQGHMHALALFGIAVCDEWISRGYKDTCRPKIQAYCLGPITYPNWFGGAIHSHYRALLLYKSPEWYGRYGWMEQPLKRIDYPLPGTMDETVQAKEPTI